MTSKEAYELIEAILSNHSSMLEVKDKRNECLVIIKQDLERLETLEKMVYTNQFENTKDIKNEFGRALTIFQNHCMAMEDTRYASDVLVRLNKQNEKLKKAIEILKNKISISVNRTVVWFETEKGCVIFKIDTQQEYELLKEVLGNE